MSEKSVLHVVLLSDFFVSISCWIVYFNLVLLCNVSSWLCFGDLLRLTSQQAHKVLKFDYQVAYGSDGMSFCHVYDVG